jgi:hypothetical protein
MSTDVHSRLTSWLDRWLDPGSFQLQVTIQFLEADGSEGFELRLGEEQKASEDWFSTLLGTIQVQSLTFIVWDMDVHVSIKDGPALRAEQVGPTHWIATFV